MKLKFKNQQFQTDAAKAVTDVFQGQRNGSLLEFTHDMGSSMDGGDLFEEDDEQGSTEAAGTDDTFDEYETPEKDIFEKSGSESDPEVEKDNDIAGSDILLGGEMEAQEEDEDETADESKDALAETDEVVDSGICGENAVWTITGTDYNLTLTISGSGNMYDYTREDTPWASLASSINKGVVEQGITGIGAYTFYGCSSMTEVIIPDSVNRMGEWAFFSCSALTDVYIPDGVTVITDTLFSGCDSLREIEIPNSVTCIEENAFSGCDSLTEIRIPENVTEIGYAAFSTCTGLRRIEIPDSITKIEGYVFAGCEKL